jgi:hypothetical protein
MAPPTQKSKAINKAKGEKKTEIKNTPPKPQPLQRHRRKQRRSGVWRGYSSSLPLRGRANQKSIEQTEVSRSRTINHEPSPRGKPVFISYFTFKILFRASSIFRFQICFHHCVSKWTRHKKEVLENFGDTAGPRGTTVPLLDKTVGSKCLWPNLGCWLVWYRETMLILLYLIVWWNLRWFLLKIKQGKFLNGLITYQCHMSMSMHKLSTYAWLWPIEFCQIVVTLGIIFSCFHDRDHVHLHIQANSYTKSYTKHAIHPPKINTPKFQRDFFSCILAKG